MKKPLQITLDTSIFVNPDSRIFFGDSPENALKSFLTLLRKKQDLHCYMPPSVYEELMKFMQNVPSAAETMLIQKKPPSSYDMPIPSIFLYEFIEEIRMRINKGLRIAEKYARKDLKINPPQGMIEEEIIKRLREEYRTALREGIIDSKEDCDLLLLAKELNSFLATSDMGLIKWAHKLGIASLSAQELKELLKP